MNYAAIDIGSNTLLLLIATVTAEGKIRALVEKAEITRLGEKLDVTGILQPEAIERTLKVLRQFTDLCHRNQVERIACVATEAVRRSRNAHDFVQRVQELCGFKVEIITGKKEAELAYLSAMLDFGETHPNLLVVDIGGGSTEIIWEVENSGEVAKLQMLSMKMGSVRFTEQFLKNDPVSSTEYSLMSHAIEDKLSQNLDSLALPPLPITLVGLAGTVTTLSSVDQKLSPYDPEKVQGSILTHTALKMILRALKENSVENRRKMVGMEPKRADVILAGAAILDAIMRKFKADQVVVSDHGIRYGLFYQKFVENK